MTAIGSSRCSQPSQYGQWCTDDAVALVEAGNVGQVVATPVARSTVQRLHVLAVGERGRRTDRRARVTSVDRRPRAARCRRPRARRGRGEAVRAAAMPSRVRYPCSARDRGVARLTRVAQQHAAAAPAEQQRRAQSGGSASGDDDVEHDSSASAARSATSGMVGMRMDVAEFDFELPDELIAQDPPRERGGSRLLVLDRRPARIEHAMFADLGRFLRPGDLLVAQRHARLSRRGCSVVGCRAGARSSVSARPVKLPTPESRECAGHDPRQFRDWEALMHPGQKLKPGARVLFERRRRSRIHGEVLERRFFGRRTIRLWTERRAGARRRDRPHRPHSAAAVHPA